MRALIMVSLALCSFSASAQVFKCIDDKTKKITFSDTPCPTSSSGGYIDVRPTNQFDGSGLRAHAAAEREAERRRRIEREREEAHESRQQAAAGSSPRDDACAAAQRRPQNSRAARSATAAACGYADPSPRRGSTMPAPPVPTAITSCDASGCWDDAGGRYTKGAGGTYFRPEGGACQMIGGQMTCP